MPFTKARAERRTEWPTTWVQKGAACALARPKFAQRGETRCAKVPDELARYDSVLTSFSGPSNLFVGKNRVVFLLEEPSSLFVSNVVQHPNQFGVDASRLITDGETVMSHVSSAGRLVVIGCEATFMILSTMNSTPHATHGLLMCCRGAYADLHNAASSCSPCVRKPESI